MEGINLGSGKNWKLKDWLGLDKIDGNYLNEESVFPFEDESIDPLGIPHQHYLNRRQDTLMFRRLGNVKTI